MDDNTELQWMAIAYINDPSSGALDSPEAAGEWFIEQLSREAMRRGEDITQFEQWALRHSPFDFTDAMRPAVLVLMNRAVVLFRARIELTKRLSIPKLTVRPGLVLPAAWENRYQTIYKSELPWFVSAILQSTFMGNPLAGEKRPWKSR
jgi:hypothetical protein